MSVTTPESPEPAVFTGRGRYVETAKQLLGVRVTREQERILRALAEHKRVHVESGNGVGKSFTTALANGAFLLRHPDSISMATSGTYSVLNDVLWKPLRRLWRREGLPGRTLESPPRIRLDDEWYFKAVAPRHPGNLEGRHAGQILVTIEEADKPDITQEHFDSAESMLTSEADRILAISNPPRDESNVAYRLGESDRWHTIRFSSFDSHNVRVDAGELDAEPIEGLVDLATIRDDWENWNGADWPGLEDARTAHRHRDDLDERWYRRRAGIIPPATAAVHRPIHLRDVKAAWERDPETRTETPDGTGIDVARSGDRTVLASVHGDTLEVHYEAQGTDHTTQETRLRSVLEEFPDHPGAIDAVGEGSGLADRLCQAYPDLVRFKAGQTAATETEFKACWAEGLALLGDWLAGGSISSRRLREELLVAARVVEFEERFYASHGADGAEVLVATSKDAIKEQLGRSPDYLDAAMQAVLAAEGALPGPVTVTRRSARGSKRNIME